MNLQDAGARNRPPQGLILLLLCLLGFPTSVKAQSVVSGFESAVPGAGPCNRPYPTGPEDFEELTLIADHSNCGAVASETKPQPEIFLSVPPRQTPSVVPSGGRGQLLTTPKHFVGGIVHDQESIWKFPWDVAHGRHWKPALAFTLATASLVELDPHDTPYFRRTQSFSGFNGTFSSFNTGLGEGLFPAAFFLVGRERKDRRMEKSALLAGEALADAEILSEIMKNIDRRLRPREINNGDFGHTWFKAGGGILIDRGSFPSGHAIGAFAMATVIAERYRQHRWVPWVAYGLAGLVGFSRISLQAHFPSDIFAGAILGYSISHFIILRNREGAP
jgi:membrane-associated phospholipid phosphatase